MMETICDCTELDSETQIFVETLRQKAEVLDFFDEELWISIVEKIEVFHDKHYKVYFKNGQTISL